MEHIGNHVAAIERNMRINSADPIALHGFTQLPNFILRNPDLSPGAKTTYALFLSYAWHNVIAHPSLPEDQAARTARRLASWLRPLRRPVATMERRLA